MRNRFSLALAALILLPSVPARAADPGDACTAAQADSWVVSESDANIRIHCDGTQWRIIEKIDESGAATSRVKQVITLGADTATCNSDATGTIRYNSTGKYIELCNGTLWEILAASSCDNTPASFEYTDITGQATSTTIPSDILQINGTDSGCTSTVSISGAGSPQYRVCSDSICNSLVQDWTNQNLGFDIQGKYVQLRTTTSASANATNYVTVNIGSASNEWVVSTSSTGSCGATPTIGQTCSDGTVYAGTSPDGNVDMYIARCDIGMSWNGSDCTGTRSALPWNNGNSSNYVTTGFSSAVDGDVNTAGIIVLDSDSGTAGVQPHQAAQACADLSVHGHTDWYLPARSELAVIYVNLQDGTPINNNPDPVITGFSTGNYWSSSENSNNLAWNQRFSDGSQSNYNKNTNSAVRCARR